MKTEPVVGRSVPESRQPISATSTIVFLLPFGATPLVDKLLDSYASHAERFLPVVPVGVGRVNDAALASFGFVTNCHRNKFSVVPVMHDTLKYLRQATGAILVVRDVNSVKCRPRQLFCHNERAKVLSTSHFIVVLVPNLE